MFTPNDAFSTPGTAQERVAWLSTWLDRYVAQGGATQPAASTLDYRARLARLRNWPGGHGIRDTPASFWVSRFMDVPNPRPLPAMNQVSEHARDLVTTWATFWGRAGVDLDQVSVPTLNSTAIGFSSFWSDFKNSDAWSAFVSSAWRHARLVVEAQSSNTARQSSSSKRAL